MIESLSPSLFFPLQKEKSSSHRREVEEEEEEQSDGSDMMMVGLPLRSSSLLLIAE